MSRQTRDSNEENDTTAATPFSGATPVKPQSRQLAIETSTNGFGSARGGKSPRPLDMSLPGQSPSIERPHRNSFIEMDGGDTESWPFGNGTNDQPGTAYPKSPSAIHPSYGVPPEDAMRSSPNVRGRYEIGDVETGKSSRRPFYQAGLSDVGTGGSLHSSKQPAWRRQLDSPGAWIVYYFFANLALTLYNKYVLVSFPFPWSLTGVHTLCGAIGARAMLSQGAFTPARLASRENTTLIGFSLLYTINIAVSNVSLNLVSVPFHQVVRAMTPLFTIAISMAFLSKRYSARTFLALAPVVMGVGFATYGDYDFTAWGFFLTLLGTVLAALKTVSTNMIMVGRLKLHPLDLLLRMSPLAFVQCVFFAYWTGELDRVRIYGATSMSLGKASGLLANGAIAFFLNIVSFSANKKTSALTMTVAANVKQVLTILLAVFLFRLHVNGTNLLGIVLTLFGGAAYAYVEFSEKRRTTKASLATANIPILEKVSPQPNDAHFAPKELR